MSCYLSRKAKGSFEEVEAIDPIGSMQAMKNETPQPVAGQAQKKLKKVVDSLEGAIFRKRR